MFDKKVLIFTANTGGGHNQAAIALKAQLTLQGFSVIIIDTFRALNPTLEFVIEDGYSVIANHVPSLYGSLYKWSNKQSTNQTLRRFFDAMLKENIKKTILNYHPQLLISTHPLLVPLIAELKKEKITSAPCVSVITDLGVHRFYLHPDVDAYITGSKATNQQLIQMGVSPDKIYDFGIPVKPSFYKSPSKSDSRIFTLLLMGGSMGSRKLLKILKLLYHTRHSIHIYVVCGKNEILFKQINAIQDHCPSHIKMDVLGYVDYVDLLMDQSDLLISKPGGLTVTEAINKRLPMIIPFYIHGQESENTEIMVNMGLGIKPSSISILPDLVDSLIAYPATLEKVKYNMDQVAQNYSVEKIGSLCSHLLA